MASSFLNVCRFNPTAGGTTDWTYSSAVTGYQSLSAAGAVNGATYSYRAESADLTQWEVGTGAYNSGTGVLTRAAVLFNSSGTTSKINFSAAPQVAVVALGEDLASLVNANSFAGTQTITNTTASTTTASGALKVSGGAGIAGDVNAAGVGVQRTLGGGLPQFSAANQGLSSLATSASAKIASGLVYGVLFVTEQLNTGATAIIVIASGVATVGTQSAAGFYTSGNASPAVGAAVGNNGTDTFLFNATGSAHNYNWMLFKIG